TSKTPSYTKSVSWQHHPTLVSFTRVMLMPKKQRARWVSPDRGILRG
ncbi:hypothetical protein ACR0HZ_003994, partial [Escherichia coli O121:H11]